MPVVYLLYNQNFTALKKFTLLLYCLFVLSMVSLKAQQYTTPNKPFRVVRCGTMEAIEESRKLHPEFAAQLEQKEKDAETAFRTYNNSSVSRTSTLTGPITIPVIVHVVDANPYKVTEESIDYLLDRLNKDYSGLNPDSTNGSSFYNVRGHSLIRFTRARRDPSGNLTNGIERKVGTVTIATTTYQAIKHASDGGLDPWDVTKYYNIWTGSSGGSGLLGIAPGIGVGGQTETTSSATGIDGVCVAIDGFSNGICGTIAAFNLGRTAVHEIGHNFGLFHTFSGCAAGADFGQLTPAGQTLPTNLLQSSDDTPGLNAATSGCPTGNVTTNCTGVPNPPGKMYQNYMDYTDDPCYSMFTIAQVNRMHYVLENFRPGYLTTNGATPPSFVPALDASSISVVSPGGSEFNTTTCVTTSYPTPACPGAFIPKVQIINNGSSTLTSVTGVCTVNGVPSAPQVFTVNLLTGRTAVLTFPSANLVTGNNTITFTTSAPNGGTDQVTTNDAITKTITIGTAVAAPLTESFEGTFPPTSWTLTQVAGAGNWAKVTTAAKTGTASAKFDNYNFAAGTISSLTTPAVTFLATATTATLNFHYAHRTYSGEPDKLEVLVSTDCGSTWTSLWSRSGTALVTVTGNLTSAFTPTAAQWTQTPIAIDLTPYKNLSVQVQFKATSGYGNNLYLDDINIFGTQAVANDAGVTVINSPIASICGNSFTPQVVVQNYGTAALTSVKVWSAVDPAGSGPTGYVSKSFTGLNIASGATTTLTLDPVTGVANGSHNFRAYTELPNGVTDQQLSNDFLVKPFVINIPITTFPVTQDFETAWTGTAAAPILTNGWAVINPDNLTTWVRTTAAKKSGVASGLLDNYSYNAPGQLDYLRSPSVNFVGKDSAYVTFHHAYKLYSATLSDTLEVVLSMDCGSTWTSIWKKGGADLATVSGTGGTFTPTAAQWSVNPDFINLESYINSGSLMIAFRNKNAYGQSLYIDDINIVGKLLNDNDASLSAIISPAAEVCEPSPTPRVRVKNAGRLVITSVKVGYIINAGTAVVQTFPVNIARGKDTLLTLNPIAALVPGTYNFKFFTSDPNSVLDQNTFNDTLAKTVAVKQVLNAPLVEGFESSTFPPVNWDTLQAPFTKRDKWQRTTTLTASQLTAAAYIRNFNNTDSSAANSIDYLVSPAVKFTASDSVFVKFDLSAATTQYPGSTSIALDTLEVELTTDCGTTWTSIYKKWGTDLQTVSSPNNGYQTAFFPTSKSQWRTDSVNLSSYLAVGGTARVRFKNTTNSGNNVFIDNVNLYSKSLSPNLKNNGFILAPNPVSSILTIQHYLAPTSLRGIGVYNSVGQRMIYMSYSGNADSYIPIDMSRFAAGIYTIKLVYTNKTIAQRIIKL